MLHHDNGSTLDHLADIEDWLHLHGCGSKIPQLFLSRLVLFPGQRDRRSSPSECRLFLLLLLDPVNQANLEDQPDQGNHDCPCPPLAPGDQIFQEVPENLAIPSLPCLLAIRPLPCLPLLPSLPSHHRCRADPQENRQTSVSLWSLSSWLSPHTISPVSAVSSSQELHLWTGVGFSITTGVSRVFLQRMGCVQSEK